MKRFNLITRILFVCLLVLPGMALGQENCANGIDDDGDGLIDCFDPDCSSNAVPTGTLFNTATNGTGGVLPGGSNDNNWQISTGSIAGPYTPAKVMSGAPGSYYNSPWPDCDWISHSTSGTHSVNTDYYYRIQFLLPCTNACGTSYSAAGTFCLFMDFFADNSVDAVYVNGILQTGIPGVPAASPYYNVGFSAAGGLSLQLCNNWQPGLNTLVIKISSGPSWAGFLAQNSTSVPSPPGNPAITPMPTNSYCISNGLVNYNSISAGGTWSATCGTCIDAANGNFDPAVAGVGNHTIYHEVSTPCYAIDSVQVSVFSPYNATIAPAGPFCPADAAVALQAADSGGTWSATCGACINAVTGVFDPALASIGANTVTYSIAASCSTMDTAIILVKPVPGVVATPMADSICNGETTNINLVSGVSGTTFNWSVSTINVSGASGDSGATIAQALTTPAVQGDAIYTITPVAAGCYGSPVNVTIHVGKVVINSVDTTGALCAGDNNGIITVHATGASAYSINGGITFQTSNTFITGAGTYTVIAKSSMGCTDTTTVVVNEPDPLLLTTALTQETCSGSCDGIILAQPAGGTQPYTYAWSIPASGNAYSIGNLCSGVYSLNLTDAHGCHNTATDTVAGPLTVNITGTILTQPSCFGYTDGEAGITATGSATIQYSLDGGTTMQAGNVFTGLAAGSYNVFIRDSVGCQNTGAFVLGQPQPLSITASNNITICSGQSTVLNATANGGTLPYTFTWDNSLPTGDSHTVFPAITTVYNVMVSDSNGCGPMAEQVTITVTPPLQVTALSNQIICPGSSANISAIAGGGNGGPYTYAWSNNANAVVLYGQNQVVSPGTATQYIVTLSDGCTTPVVTDTVLIGLYTLPAIHYTADTTAGCTPVVVHFTNTSAPAASCSWDFGDGSTGTGTFATHIYTTPGCHHLTLTIVTPDGCITDTVVNNQVCVYPVPVAGFTFSPNPTDVFNTDISFTNLTLGGNQYAWDFNGLGTSAAISPAFIFPTDTGGVYNVCLWTANNEGCMDSICHAVEILDDVTLYVPNSFTPNGDGINDLFGGIGRGIQDYEMMVFNRWGEMIFRSTDITKHWDGMHKSIRAKQDVYTWKVRYTSVVRPSEVKEVMGHVTLLR